MSSDIRPELANLQARIARTLDEVRAEAAEKRHATGYRTARENLADLVDEDSGQRVQGRDLGPGEQFLHG